MPVTGVQTCALPIWRFRGVPTSFICDAMDGRGSLDWRIKPVAGGGFAGVALTCHCGPSDILALQVAVARSQPGDVLVAASDQFAGSAVVGDLLLGIAKNRGVVGFVTDGLVRDRADLQTLGMPVFAMGVCPNSPYKGGPGSVGLPVICGGRSIASGDIIVGDTDGVVTIPQGQIGEVLANLDRVRAAEAEALAKVKGGQSQVAAADELLKGPHVRWV